MDTCLFPGKLSIAMKFSWIIIIFSISLWQNKTVGGISKYVLIPYYNIFNSNLNHLHLGGAQKYYLRLFAVQVKIIVKE